MRPNDMFDPAPERNLEAMRDVAQGANEERADETEYAVEWGVGDFDTSAGIYLVGDAKPSRTAALMSISDIAARYPDDQPLLLIHRHVGPWVRVASS